MQTNRWKKIEDIFERATAFESNERAAFVEKVCGADADLKREIISLLENHENSADFLSDALFSTGLQILETESDEFLGKKNFAHYNIEKLLGRGGMGTVYLAEDEKLKRRVALKILPRQFTDNEEYINLFRQEARAASQFSHPNIAHVYEFGNVSGQFYLTMEYVRGTTLRELAGEKKLSLKQSVIIVLQICKALAVAHRAGITHRDIKPENVIVASDDETVKVLDFGLAKFEENSKDSGDSILDTSILDTSPEIIAGTTAYMSPEQVRGKNADFSTDVWSLGVTFYELVAGHRPFQGETKSDVHAAILLKEIELPQAALDYPKLENILRKSLAKDLANRYKNADEMREDLRDFLSELNEKESARNLNSVENVSSERDISKFAKHPIFLSAIVGIILISLIFGFYFYKNRRGFSAQNSTFAVKSERITNRGRAVRSALSPNENLLAYALEENGEQAIYLYRSDAVEAEKTKILIPPASRKTSGMTFAPDGKSLYVAARSGDEAVNTLYKISLAEDNPSPQKILADLENAPDVSPDGKRVAFLRLSNDDTHEEIRIADADGQNERLLYERRMPEYIPHLTQPVFSPDGKKILLAGGVYNADKQEIYPFLIDVETGKAEQFFAAPWEEIWHLDWLPDMSGFVFSGRENRTYDNKQLWLVSYPGGEIKRLTEDYKDYYGVSVSTAGGKTYLSTIVLNRVAQLWKTNVEDKNFQPVSLTSEGNYGLGLSQSADGKIFVGSTNDGNPDIWSLEKDGNNLKQLTFDKRLDQNPKVAADGQTIVFSSERTGIKTLWRMKTDGGDQKPLLERATIDNFTVAPDGKNVFYYSYFDNKGALWRVGLDGENREKIIDGRFEAPAVSHDGKQIAAVYKKDEEAKYQIAVWNLTDKNPVRFIRPLDGNALPGDIYWKKDGTSLVYILSQKGVGNLWEQSVAEPETKKQLTFFTSSRLFHFAFSEDEKEAVCARGLVEGYLVLMSLE